jgi:ribosomal protein S18 acetylase RimI-like enzyme
VIVRPVTTDDRAWIVDTLRGSWNQTTVVSRGRAIRADELPGFIAEIDGTPCGLATYDIVDGDMELVTIDAIDQQHGVGTALVNVTVELARARQCRRLWLVTTNDNVDAIRFYQRRGFRLVAVHVNAVDEARMIKPSIPLIGDYGVAVHDEIEFEILTNPQNL